MKLAEGKPRCHWRRMQEGPNRGLRPAPAARGGRQPYQAAGRSDPRSPSRPLRGTGARHALRICLPTPPRAETQAAAPPPGPLPLAAPPSPAARRAARESVFCPCARQAANQG